MKKVTVIGIIGKTQGVNIARKPARSENRKNIRSDFFSSLSIPVAFPIIFVGVVLAVITFPVSDFLPMISEFFATVFTAAISFPPGFPLIVKLNSISSGGMDRLSSQHINSSDPLTWKSLFPRTLIFCLKTALISKYLNVWLSNWESFSSMGLG